MTQRYQARFPADRQGRGVPIARLVNRANADAERMRKEAAEREKLSAPVVIKG